MVESIIRADSVCYPFLSRGAFIPLRMRFIYNVSVNITSKIGYERVTHEFALYCIGTAYIHSTLILTGFHSHLYFAERKPLAFYVCVLCI